MGPFKGYDNTISSLFDSVTQKTGFLCEFLIAVSIFAGADVTGRREKGGWSLRNAYFCSKARKVVSKFLG